MNNLNEIIAQLQVSYNEIKGLTPPDQAHLPSDEEIDTFLSDCRHILFPSKAETITEDTLLAMAKDLRKALEKITPDSETIVSKFLSQLPVLRRTLAKDAQAHYEGDPAAKSLQEVLLTYPGFSAILIHRIAHFFYQENVPLLPRLMSEFSHKETGIDIHPDATIGNYFCIDHGTGIVIGETTHIGNHVKLYQGVTLGALSVTKSLSTTKRHPTIQDRVTIYSGTTILGGETLIGHDTIIGGNVWITASVPAKSKVYLSSDKRQIIKTELSGDSFKGEGI